MDADLAATSCPSARSRRPRAVIALVVVALLAVVAGVPAASATTTSDPFGDELMRLTNLDRKALCKAALTIDPTLAAFARDYAFTCPTKPSMTIRGRAQDMADRDYFSHDVAGCLKADGSTLGALDAMAVLGYSTARAENIAKNSYGTGAATYKVGCALDGTGCASSTPSISTVAVAQRGFMSSDGHRRNILGSYDRFGCGSALGADGWYYYACVFSMGGPAIAPAPTPPPPAVVADATPPTFLRFTGTSVVRAGYGRTIGATVADDVLLARLEVRIDGRLARAWTLSGTSAVRSVLVSSSWLRAGRHQVRWTLRDAAGHVVSRSYWLYVR
ncbi:MAG: CAP domain-containing protein [Chloroflexi bacterium]|nr:CAP domain-containing protein [Chloroflexota bacterium]